MCAVSLLTACGVPDRPSSASDGPSTCGSAMPLTRRNLRHDRGSAAAHAYRGEQDEHHGDDGEYAVTRDHCDREAALCGS
jgi:hypothetical protein